MTYLNEDYYVSLRITHKFHIQNKWFSSRKKSDRSLSKGAPQWVHMHAKSMNIRLRHHSDVQFSGYKTRLVAGGNVKELSCLT